MTVKPEKITKVCKWTKNKPTLKIKEKYIVKNPIQHKKVVNEAGFWALTFY